jgi:membrane protease YdiL (CAAX protease family)
MSGSPTHGSEKSSCFPRRISSAEILVVLLGCLGVFLVPALVHLGFKLAGVPAPRVWWAIGMPPGAQSAYEMVALIGVASLLSTRNSGFRGLFFRLTWREAVVVVFFAAGTLVAVRFHLFDPLWKKLGSAYPPFWQLVALVLINPVFEELVELGYVFHAMETRGRWLTLITSAAVRGAIHLGFGIPFAIAVFGWGLLAGAVYWRTRRLLPIILIHFVADVAAIWPRLNR